MPCSDDIVLQGEQACRPGDLGEMGDIPRQSWGNPQSLRHGRATGTPKDRAGHPATGYANSLNVGALCRLLPHSWGSVTPASHEIGSRFGVREAIRAGVGGHFPVGAPLRDQSNG